MNCPKCNSQMEKGKLFNTLNLSWIPVEESIFSSQSLFGRSFMRYFCGLESEAFKCVLCKTIVFEAEK